MGHFNFRPNMWASNPWTPTCQYLKKHWFLGELYPGRFGNEAQSLEWA